MADDHMSSTPGAPDTDWLDDHIELYAVDVLADDEAARVETGLDGLPAVQRAIYDARIVETQQAITGMASSYALTAPDALRSRVLDHVFATGAPSTSTPIADVDTGPAPEGDTPTGTVTPLHSARRGRIAGALAAAAVVVAVALGAGVLIGRNTAPDSATQTAAAQSQQIAEVLSAPDATLRSDDLQDDRGRMSVITSRSLDRAVALLRDLRNPIDSDQTFQLWLVGKSQDPVSAGLIAGTGARSPVVVSQLGGSRVLAVTIEPDGGSPQPTTPILAQIPL